MVTRARPVRDSFVEFTEHHEYISGRTVFGDTLYTSFRAFGGERPTASHELCLPLGPFSPTLWDFGRRRRRRNGGVCRLVLLANSELERRVSLSNSREKKERKKPQVATLAALLDAGARPNACDSFAGAAERRVFWFTLFSRGFGFCNASSWSRRGSESRIRCA